MSDGTDWCRHYRGVMKTCAAGIEPKTVMRQQSDVNRWLATGSHGDRKRLYPCFETDGVAHACPHCSYYTPAERQSQREESARRWQKFADDLDANRCPFCNAAIEQRKQVGRCVYAHPCGHRLYQGRA